MFQHLNSFCFTIFKIQTIQKKKKKNPVNMKFEASEKYEGNTMGLFLLEIK